MKKILKAFEKWRNKIVYTDKERKFSKRYSGHEAISAKGFYAGYKAGQKAEREKDSFMWRFNDDLTPLEGLKVTITGHPVEDPTEWIPLELDNLPGDILTGDYVFQWFSENNWEAYGFCKRTEILDDLDTDKVRYRPIQKEPEKKDPTMKCSSCGKPCTAIQNDQPGFVGSLVAVSSCCRAGIDDTEKEDPTHEEITALWWNVEKSGWQKVDRVWHDSIGAKYHFPEFGKECFLRIQDFKDMESDIKPPEK